MKASLIRLLLYSAIVLLIACSESSNGLKETENGFNPSSSVFEGEWTWLETQGSGLDGQAYVRDSVSEGYSWKFDFYESNGPGGKLQTYKNDVKETLYVYEYTIEGTVSGNPLMQHINLDRMGNDLPEVYFWEIKYSDEKSHLFLRNANYFRDDCCSEKFEHHFLLTGPGHF